MATVLIVDDEADHRTVVEGFLREHGHTVLVAADGDEGVRLAREHLPGVVLMDASLPRVDGWSAAAELRRLPGAEQTVVVVLARTILPEHRAIAAAVGCQFCLRKPTPLPEVLEVVRRSESARRSVHA